MKKYQNLKFQQATPEDSRSLVDFEKEVADLKLYGTPLNYDAALKEIANNKYYFIFNNGTLVGTAAYCLREDGSYYISNIAVAKEYRRNGIARQAVKFLLDQCGLQRRIDLTVHPENDAAIKLYQSLGFNIETSKENYYGDGEPRYIMVKIK